MKHGTVCCFIVEHVLRVKWGQSSNTWQHNLNWKVLFIKWWSNSRTQMHASSTITVFLDPFAYWKYTCRSFGKLKIKSHQHYNGKKKKMSKDQKQKRTHLGLMEEEKWRSWRLPGRPWGWSHAGVVPAEDASWPCGVGKHSNNWAWWWGSTPTRTLLKWTEYTFVTNNDFRGDILDSRN